MQSKTVAQCVEFYYTYKRQVKIGRNGILTFGPPESPAEKQLEAVVDEKVERVAASCLGEREMEEMELLKIPPSILYRVLNSVCKIL